MPLVTSWLDINDNELFEQLSYKDMCKLLAEDEEDFPTAYPLSYSEIAHETSSEAAIQKARMTKPDRHNSTCLLLNPL
jgi:hypothetical protein